MEKNNSLIPIKENFFKKVFNFFKGIFFKKNNISNIHKENEITEQKENIDNSVSDFIKLENIDVDNSAKFEISGEMKENKNDFLTKLEKNGYVFEKYEFVADIDFEEDKKRFFEIYENVKNGKINIKDLSVIDLIRINQLLTNEVDIKQSKIY